MSRRNSGLSSSLDPMDASLITTEACQAAVLIDVFYQPRRSEAIEAILTLRQRPICRIIPVVARGSEAEGAAVSSANFSTSTMRRQSAVVDDGRGRRSSFNAGFIDAAGGAGGTNATAGRRGRVCCQMQATGGTPKGDRRHNPASV